MKNLRGIKVLSENDMKSVTGGSTNIPIEKRFLDKSVCLEEVKWLGQYRIVTGMSGQEIAEEIYAHAVLYYKGLTVDEIANALNNSGIPGLELSGALHKLIADMLISRGEVISIADGGDTGLRKLLYKGIWKMF